MTDSSLHGFDPTRVDRVLIIHGDAAMRRHLEDQVRRCRPQGVAFRSVETPSQAPSLARGFAPRFVLIALDAESAAALNAARALRAPDRLIIGLTHPQSTSAQQQVDLMRQAIRAGVGDFLPLPVPEAELRQILAQAPTAGTVQTPGSAVVFFSHQGGVGVTTLALRTAIALSRLGATALVDGHLQFGSLADHLGLQPDFDVSDLARHRDQGAVPAFESAVPEIPRLSFLAGPSDPRRAARMAPEDLGRAMIDLRLRHQFVVVDTPPVLDAPTLNALDLADRVVLVTEGTRPTLLATRRTLEVLRGLGIDQHRLRLVLSRDGSTQDRMPAKQAAEVLQHPIAQVIPYAAAIAVAGHRGTRRVAERDAPAFSKAVKDLAVDLARRQQPQPVGAVL